MVIFCAELCRECAKDDFLRATTSSVLILKGLYLIDFKGEKEMREAGIEPARGYPHRILSPVCLPVPPLSHSC